MGRHFQEGALLGFHYDVEVEGSYELHSERAPDPDYA